MRTSKRTDGGKRYYDDFRGSNNNAPWPYDTEKEESAKRRNYVEADRNYVEDYGDEEEDVYDSSYREYNRGSSSNKSWPYDSESKKSTKRRNSVETEEGRNSVEESARNSSDDRVYDRSYREYNGGFKSRRWPYDTKRDNYVERNEDDEDNAGGSRKKARRNDNSGVKADYSIKRGDTLSKIAKDNGMSLKELLKLNPHIKNANHIYVGDKINLGRHENEESSGQMRGRAPEIHETRSPREYINNELQRRPEPEDEGPVIDNLEGETANDEPETSNRTRGQIRADRRAKNAEALRDYVNGDMTREEYRSARRENRAEARKQRRARWKIDI